MDVAACSTSQGSLALPDKDPFSLNTISIYILAKGPRIDTIGKNPIQNSFIFCIELLSLSVRNLILSLKIIPQYIE